MVVYVVKFMNQINKCSSTNCVYSNYPVSTDIVKEIALWKEKQKHPCNRYTSNDLQIISKYTYFDITNKDEYVTIYLSEISSTKEIDTMSITSNVYEGVIDTAVQRVIANYKLAIPHYYNNKIQLLIPLCFNNLNKPDVALVLDKMNSNYYQATTCLDMQMAYMDARLIAKPESNWLSI